MQISLVSQVAATYLTLAADRERLQLAQETLASQQASYKLTKSRFDAGVSSALDLSQAQTSVDAARVDIARFTTLVAQDENALNLVVGSAVPADLLPQALSGTLTALKDVSPGLPSDVLLQPPRHPPGREPAQGVQRQHRRGAGGLFPTDHPGRLASVPAAANCPGFSAPGSLIWSFAPRITLPIFDAGSNQANLKVAEVDRDIAVAQYEKAIQTAFREVADALAQRGTIDEQVAAQQSLTDATAESYRLSQARYEKGVDSYLHGARLPALAVQRPAEPDRRTPFPARQSGDALQGPGRRERVSANSSAKARGLAIHGLFCYLLSMYVNSSFCCDGQRPVNPSPSPFSQYYSRRCPFGRNSTLALSCTTLQCVAGTKKKAAGEFPAA